MSKNLLDLSHTKAREFFLREKNYLSLDLPLYFQFSSLLRNLSKKLEKIKRDGSNDSLIFQLEQFCSGKKPGNYEGVNYKILNNKDGAYSWRAHQLIHPFLYVQLVHIITEEEHWNEIVRKFREDFQSNKSIKCESIPVEKAGKQKPSNPEQIKEWVKKVEKESIKLSLEYDYIFHADIAGCYGSIYTHSIPWALESKDVSKKNRWRYDSLGNMIDFYIQQMTEGQTNGIPEGSVLMDFVAEIVLGYIDQKLSEELCSKDWKEEDYKIIRYRDDYRVFVNNPEVGRVIIKVLTEQLSGVGMKLHPDKTTDSDDVISASIKPDKLFSVLRECERELLRDQLLVIRDLAKRYPNSGSLPRELGYLHEQIISGEKKTKGDKGVLISIVMDIAFNNPRVYPQVSAILGELLFPIKCKKTREDLINKIKRKFEKLPNTEYLDLWLQRLTIKEDRNSKYRGKLCERAMNGEGDIWVSDWLHREWRDIISSAAIVSEPKIKKMKKRMTTSEVKVFGNSY